MLIVFSVAVACGGLTAVSLINQAADRSQQASQSPWVNPAYTITAGADTAPLTKQDYAMLRQRGITQAVAFASKASTVTCSGSATAHDITVSGIDTLAAVPLADNDRHASLPVTTSAGPIALVSEATLAALNCNTVQPASNTRHTSPLTLVAGPLPDGVLLTDLTVFYHWFSVTQAPLNTILIPFQLNADEESALRAMLPAHLSLKRSPLGSDGTLTDSFQLNLWAMSAMMAMVSVFIVVNALNLMYRSRLHLLRQLRQLGVGALILLLALQTEVLLYTAIGALGGVLGGAWLTTTLTPALQTTFTALFDLSFAGADAPITGLFLTAWGLSMLAVGLFVAIPARQLSSLSERLTASSPGYLPYWPGLAALIVIVVVPVIASSTLSALLTVGAVLLAGCVMILVWLPPLLRLVHRMLPARFVLLHYASASAVKLSTRTRLAVCAFFIALTANTGMNVMTDSFRNATSDWLLQRLNAEGYVYTHNQHAPAEVPDSVTVVTVYRADAMLSERPVKVRSYPFSRRARESLVLDTALPDAWQTYADYQGVFVNQQLAFRHQLDTGDVLTLRLASGEALRRTVVGIYPDYGNPDAQLMMPPDTVARYGQYGGLSAVYLDSPAASDSLTNWLASLPSDYEYYDANTLYSLSMKTFDRTFVVTDALNIATLLVAALSFLVSVFLVSLDSRPQYAVLRMLGVSGARLKILIAGQYLLLCAMTAALALPAGIGLAWVFIDKVNRYAFSWIYPLSVDAGVLLQSAALSLVSIMLVLVLPLTRLSSRVDLRQETRT
ncbi:ABC transporter permease [Alteromonas sp. CYL-A6]|uniref:ABC transporter permease n=1 Tax=Alteromonas nitratireducens TaxID=3390813 RepID=UPI0034B22E8C